MFGAIGLAVVRMGGGRMKEGDRIDPSVGFSDILTLGEEVSRGQPLARLHAASEKAALQAERAFLDAVTIAEGADVPPLLHDRVT